MRFCPVTAFNLANPCKCVRGHLLLVLLLASTFASPMVLGQSADDLVQISVEPNATSVAVGVDSPGSFTADITYDSSNPLDDVQDRTILVDLEGVPDGWTANVEPAHFSLANHATMSVTVTVAVTPGAAADDMQVVINARLMPRGVADVPSVGGQIEPEETASASVDVLREDPLTREALEAVGPWLWLVLAAALVLAIIAAKLVYDTRRTAVKLHCKVTEAAVLPGGRVAVPMRVENVTRVEDTIVFHVAPMPDGWSAHLPVPELDLDGHQSEELHLIIQAPANARAGDRHNVGVSAHSAQAPKRAAELVLAAVVDSDEPAKS